MITQCQLVENIKFTFDIYLSYYINSNVPNRNVHNMWLGVKANQKSRNTLTFQFY